MKVRFLSCSIRVDRVSRLLDLKKKSVVEDRHGDEPAGVEHGGLLFARGRHVPGEEVGRLADVRELLAVGVHVVAVVRALARVLSLVAAQLHLVHGTHVPENRVSMWQYAGSRPIHGSTYLVQTGVYRNPKFGYLPLGNSKETHAIKKIPHVILEEFLQQVLQIDGLRDVLRDQQLELAEASHS